MSMASSVTRAMPAVAGTALMIIGWVAGLCGSDTGKGEHRAKCESDESFHNVK